VQGGLLVGQSQPDGARSFVLSRDDAGWHPVGGPANARVRFITTSNGETVIGGRFTSIGGVGCNRIARWYQNRVWVPLSFSVDGFNDEAIGACDHAGSLAVYGEFTTAGGVTVNRIALWNGASWQALDQGFSGPPTGIASFQGNLYACGGFAIIGGAGSVSTARWDGSAWQPVPGVEDVLTMMVHEGELVVGGTFTHIGDPSIDANHIAAFDGTAWRAIGTGVPGPGVNDLAAHEGALYATSLYPDGINAGVYRFDGAAWRPLPKLAMPTSTALPSDLLSHDGILHAAGFFETAGPQTSYYYARWAMPAGDFNHDGDTGTDQDIEAFFACLAGQCCPTCSSADFNGDGDFGTDQDIEAFFRVLAGGNC
jgi:hypothetical protein